MKITQLCSYFGLEDVNETQKLEANFTAVLPLVYFFLCKQKTLNCCGHYIYQKLLLICSSMW